MSIPPPRFQLRVSRSPRIAERFPVEDDALGESLFSIAKDALEKGFPRPAMLVVRDAEVEQFDLAPLSDADPGSRLRMTAAIGGQADAECSAIVGTVRIGLRGQPAGRALVVYLEWPDNRWWSCWQIVSDDRTLQGDGPAVRRAVDGWPRPGGVGGWFARARREGLRLRLDRPGQQEGMGLVH